MGWTTESQRELGPAAMSQLVIQNCPTAREDFCGVCGRLTTAAAGVQICVAEGSDVVCKDCGRKHAPELEALAHLAGEAERVARIGRHTVFPPLTALLDLARAADNYHHVAGITCKPIAATETR
jgi:hypothetical protein